MKEARKVKAVADQVIRFNKAWTKREEEEKNEPEFKPGKLPSRHSKTDADRLAESGAGFVVHELPKPKNAGEAIIQALKTGLATPEGSCEICKSPGPVTLCKKITFRGKLRDQVTACPACASGFLKRLGYQ